MNFKKIKPVTSSSRNLIQINNKHLTKNFEVKSKIIKLKNTSGRNKKITTFNFNYVYSYEYIGTDIFIDIFIDIHINMP